MKCQKCGEEVDELVRVKVDKKTVKVCEACAEDLRSEQEIGDSAEDAMGGMMEYKGRR